MEEVRSSLHVMTGTRPARSRGESAVPCTWPGCSGFAVPEIGSFYAPEQEIDGKFYVPFICPKGHKFDRRVA